MKIDLNSSDFYSGIQAANREVKDLTGSMQKFDSVLRESQGDLKAAADELTRMMASQRAAAAAAKDLAQAKIAEAKATADSQRAVDQHNESLGRQEVSAQRAGQAQEAAHLATTRAANESARTQAATTTQMQQGEIAQQRLTMAQEKHSASQQRAKQNELELQDNLSNTRYLLYDVGATLELTSGALIAWSSASTVAAASYQKDFAQVLRISDQSLASAQSLRDGLVHLTTDLPVNFDEATGIAQMGAHLQLGNEGLVAFTDTVAKFTAATGVSAETSSQLFSRMKTSMADAGQAGTGYFNQLGSSIAQMGTVVVATDTEIASMITQINAVTASAGIGTAATVGLAGAMASLRIQPEMARGALTRLFANFNRDSAESTDKMAQFGKVMGMTGEQAATLWKSDPDKFFNTLVKGLHDAYQGGQNLTVLFDQMGIKNVRDVNTLQRLAVGYDVLTKSMAAANKGYTEGTALNELSKPIFETLAAKAEELGNAIKGFLDKIGSAGLAPLTSLVDGLKNFIVMLTDLQDKAPVLTVIINALLGIGAVAGVLLGVRAAMAFILAGLVSMQQAMGGNVAGSISLNGILRQVAATMLVAKGASDSLANSLVRNESGFRAVALAAGASKTSLEGMTVATDATAAATNRAALSGGGFTGGLKSMAGALGGLVGGLPGLIALVGIGLVGAFIAAEDQATQAGKAIAEALKTGADAGKKAIGEELVKRTVGLTDVPTVGIWNNGKNLRELADQVGVSFQSMIDSIGQGDKSLDAFHKSLDALGQSKGAKDFNDAVNRGMVSAGDAQIIGFLANNVDSLGKRSASSAKDVKAVGDATKGAGASAAGATPQIDENGNAIEDTGTKADASAKKIDAYVKSLFGIVDAQGATQDALSKLGQGLYKSLDISPLTEGGRTNLKAFQEVIKNAALEQQQLVASGKQTTQQAAVNYGAFIDDLVAQLGQKGVNVGQISSIANQAKNIFATQLNNGNDPTIKVKVDNSKVNDAKAYLDSIVAKYGTTNLDVILKAGGTAQVQQNVYDMQQYILSATGEPYVAEVKAATQNAYTDTGNFADWAMQTLLVPYVADIVANTDPAQATLNAFGAFADGLLSTIGNAVIHVLNLLDRARGGAGDIPLNNVKWSNQSMASVAAPEVRARPAIPVPAAAAASPGAGAGLASQADSNKAGLDGLADGYDKAGDAAEKAGKKGKKAGQDMANGIDEASQAAEEYGNRLKQGLDHAFQMQYGMSAATDAYHQKLNEINKARDDENKKVSDLRDKIKALNDEMRTELVDANKAKIEQTISVKYGEVARAEDYGAQAQKHLDTAAAKQKEIDANQKEMTTTQAGIGQLDGYTDAAIKNRAALRDLEQKHLDMVVAYAKTGASIEQVRTYAQQLDSQFASDVSQLGYNQNAVNNLIGDLGRYIGVINSVPYVKPTAVTADTGQAEGAIQGVKDMLSGLGNQPPVVVDVVIRGGARLEKDGNGNNIQGPGGQPVWDVFDSNGNMMQSKVFNQGGQVPGFASGGLIPGSAPSDPTADNMMASVDGKGAIRVRSREFIQPQEAVDHYGLQFMEDIRRMRLPKFSSASGPSTFSAPSGGGGGDMQVTSLSADSLAMLAKMSDRPIYLFTNDEVIARSAARGNTVLATKGVS